jgi:hypothetical protein
MGMEAPKIPGKLEGSVLLCAREISDKRLKRKSGGPKRKLFPLALLNVAIIPPYRST